MAPITHASDESNHQALLDQLDLYGVRKPWRNLYWKYPQRRNKNVKQIVAEAARREASVQATQNNSGISTPLPLGSEMVTGAAATPVGRERGHTDIAQAAQNLSRLVTQNGQAATLSSSPAVTYTSLEAPPSVNPASQRRYCDVTGLSAPYTDPKTRLRYHNAEVFALIRTMGQGMTEQYLAARGAHTVLK